MELPSESEAKFNFDFQNVVSTHLVAKKERQFLSASKVCDFYNRFLSEIYFKGTNYPYRCLISGSFLMGTEGKSSDINISNLMKRAPKTSIS